MNRFVVLFAILFPIVSMATDMCARDDTMIIVFDPKIAGHRAGLVDFDTWRWVAEFSYGAVYGHGACVSEYEFENKKSEIKPASRGVDENGNERTICVCRMEYPLQSEWIKATVNSSAENCVTSCASTNRSCGHYMYASDQGFRQAVFDSFVK